MRPDLAKIRAQIAIYVKIKGQDTNAYETPDPPPVPPLPLEARLLFANTLDDAIRPRGAVKQEQHVGVYPGDPLKKGPKVDCPRGFARRSLGVLPLPPVGFLRRGGVAVLRRGVAEGLDDIFQLLYLLGGRWTRRAWGGQTGVIFERKVPAMRTCMPAAAFPRQT